MVFRDVKPQDFFNTPEIFEGNLNFEVKFLCYWQYEWQKACACGRMLPWLAEVEALGSARDTTLLRYIEPTSTRLRART